MLVGVCAGEGVEPEDTRVSVWKVGNKRPERINRVEGDRKRGKEGVDRKSIRKTR